ncbi:exodeoxyribonuclease V subunit gamma [Nocardioides coralli]|uniref:exodeoxyribonuclease V subunit gamma n=1 Tax=Nocardioides coralli TaxID=2872154 RepID=UPI001CA419E0|nr:exodeoxyribonuclease V subunit gamma [Nocardioides coralli]QZY29299.1 exodeoxyribonuclease V subunit gamma [Nocardioides coralli]
MTLFWHRAPRADQLADGLGRLLATPLPDPFATEVVAVPARGVERWLSQRLSHRLGEGPRGGDGVCAGVRFLSPRSLVSLLLGRDRDDPWDPDRLVWPVLAAIDAALDEPWAETLARHLGHGVAGDEGELRRSRRWSVARRLAGILASYAVQRPALVADWRAGRDTDGTGQPLDADLRWQPELWRRVLDLVGETPPDVRHAETLVRLRAGDDGLDLPDRLSLFGHTRLPVTEVELLAALGERRDVHLWTPQPSITLAEALQDLDGVVPRDEDDSTSRVGHPLLGSLGRDSRELVRALQARATEVDHVPDPTAPDTLLGWLQADVRANRAPEPATRAGRELRPDDRSLQVHACHGAARQVEVLREVLVGLLADDPTLEPRDILVMCPDIEAFAPLVAAGFGLEGVVDDGHPAHRLRVRLADRALSSTNPLLAVAARLVELAGGRVTASEVLDLAATDVCRRRFDLDDDDLARLTDWVGEAGIRWGLDEAQRAGFAMERFPHNTWRSGLDRLLLGAAMSGDDHRHVGRGLPVDDVGSGDLDLLGRFAELVDRLDRCVAELGRADTLQEWVTALRSGVGALTEADPGQPWQGPQLERELAQALDAATDGGRATVRLADVRALLRSRLGGRPTRANFRTGTLTVCTMVPMRSVPHRVVCLVGLDDGAFPRGASVDGDDALLRRPLTGERDARSEDRQLLLDAVLAATETLVVTYTGANEHTGAERPPAVPLGEVLDAADLTVATPVRDRVLVRHPLQPHDPRNLQPGALVGDRPFSFDRAALAGARAALAERTPPAPFLPGPLPAPPRDDVNLADLRDFFAHPVRAFLRGRLDLATPLEATEVEDAIPIEVRGLDKWRIGDRLLREVLAGSRPDTVMTAELLRGTLPPFRLGEAAFETVVQECSAIYAATAALREDRTATSRDVAVDLGDGRLLTGTVTQLFGHRLLSVGYSALKGRQRLAVWIDLLALSAAYPDEHWTGHAVGKGDKGADGYVSGPLDHRAAEWLRTLVELYDEGQRRPLPLPVETALAAAGRRLGTPGARSPETAWCSTDNSPVPGEREDAWHVRVHGERAPLEVLRADGLDDLAVRVWEPLLTGAERKVTL